MIIQRFITSDTTEDKGFNLSLPCKICKKVFYLIKFEVVLSSSLGIYNNPLGILLLLALLLRRHILASDLHSKLVVIFFVQQRINDQIDQIEYDGEYQDERQTNKVLVVVVVEVFVKNDWHSTVHQLDASVVHFIHFYTIWQE